MIWRWVWKFYELEYFIMQGKLDFEKVVYNSKFNLVNLFLFINKYLNTCREILSY